MINEQPQTSNPIEMISLVHNTSIRNSMYRIHTRSITII